MPYGQLTDHTSVESFVPQTFRDTLGADHVPNTEIFAEPGALQTAFFEFWPSVLSKGNPRLFKGFYPRVFKSGGYQRIFKS
jgi:hypothetical protein